MDNLIEGLSQCTLAVLTLLLGWLSPTPKQIVRRIIAAAGKDERKHDHDDARS